MDYKLFVEEMAFSKQNNLFLNSGPIHASIVMSRMFKYAKNHIEMYCGGFNGAVSNDSEYLIHLENFLQKGKMKVLIEEDLSNNPESKVYSVFRKYLNNVEIRLANGKIVNSETKDSVHFAIADDRMMRFETGTFDYTAQVNFNDPDQCKSLLNTFSIVWNNSSQLKVV